MPSLCTLEEATGRIRSGAPLLIAGEESLLKALPRGNWIGGTIPYFMTEDGGVIDRSRVFLTEFPSFVSCSAIKTYGVDDLPRIPEDYADNGCSWIILPAGSEALLTFGHDSATYDGVFDTPLVGWVAGVHLSDLGKVTPKAFNGFTGECCDNAAVVLHAGLPSEKTARVELLNLFRQGKGPAITFQEGGFQIGDCMVDGEKQNLAEYISRNKLDTRLPLVADYSGACINVSVQSVDAAAGIVNLYAAVFPGNVYRFAEPVADYAASFSSEMAKRQDQPAFSCNCILNFLYAGLEGQRTGSITGPITFGEVAYILLNQTMVYTVFEDLG
nr:hypothetical protein [uncultured Holophaga sp.]